MSVCIVRVYIVHRMTCTQNMYKVVCIYIHAYYVNTR